MGENNTILSVYTMHLQNIALTHHYVLNARETVNGSNKLVICIEINHILGNAMFPLSQFVPRWKSCSKLWICHGAHIKSNLEVSYSDHVDNRNFLDCQNFFYNQYN